MTMTPRKRRELEDWMGTSGVQALLDSIKALGRQLEQAGVSYKEQTEGPPTSFAEADVEDTLSVYGMLVANILAHPDLSPAAKVARIEQVGAELTRRIKGKGGSGDKAVDAHLTAAVESATEALTDAQPQAVEAVVTGLKAAVLGVVDRRGHALPAARYVLDLMRPAVKARAYPLGRVWTALGLTAFDVAQHVSRADGTKELGVTRAAVYQKLASGKPAHVQQLVTAVVGAARAKGASETEIRMAIDTLTPDLTGGKGYNPKTAPAARYVDDLMRHGAVRG